VSSDGGAAVTVRGVCWSTSVNPTTSNSKTTNGSGTGSFTSSITGLSQGTTYHVRAYATNSVGTSYGSDRSFTTQGTEIASVEFYNSLVCGGNPFTATFTIGGEALTSVTGNFSKCEEVACGKSLSWSLYADTGGCGTLTGSGSKTLSCDCLYTFVLDLNDDGDIVLYTFYECPGDCSGLMSPPKGERQLLDSLRVAEDGKSYGFSASAF